MSKSWMIHIVEDSEPVRASLSFVLPMHGFRVLTYVDAAEFLKEQMAERGMLISDIRMPGMSGIELTTLLRQRGARLPIVLMTGHSTAELRQEAIDAGADALLEKPVKLPDLLETIAKVTDRAEDADLSLAPRLR